MNRDTLHQYVLHLPVVTTFLAAFFCYQLFSRYRQKGGGPHLLWWGIGMATYGIGTMTEAATTIFGWNPVVFRAWYISGAFLGGYPLAQGSIYLLMPRRFANASAWIVSTLIAIASIFVVLTPLDVALSEPHRLSGSVIVWSWVRLISPFFNLYSLVFLVGGAVVSAIRFKKAPQLRHRYVGNILIAIGALLPGIGGAMTRAGWVEVLYVTELVGLSLIYLGYRSCVRVPVAVREPQAVRAVTLLLAALLLSSPGPVLAADGEEREAEEATSVGATEEKPEATFFASTTVTATGSEERAFEVPTPVTVIEAGEIQLRQPESAADLLRTEVGVDVNGVGPNQARPIIRGQRGLRVLFMENGLRMNNARRQTDFGEIPSLVSVDSVEAVEVVRGAASVLYGTDAIGGVLNLVTKAPSFGGAGVRGSLNLRYGDAGDQGKFAGEIGGAGQRTAYQFGLSVRDADDYSAPAGSFGDIMLERETTVVDTGVQDESLFGSLHFQVNDRHRLFFRLNAYGADDAGFGFVEPEDFGSVPDARIRITYPYQDFERYTLGYLAAGLDSPVAETLETQLYYQRNERELSNDIAINIGPVGPGFPDSSVEADTLNFTDLESLGLRLQATRPAGASHFVTWGAEFWEDDSVNTDTSTTTTTIRFPFPPFAAVSESHDDIANTPNATNSSWGFFGQDEILVGEDLKLLLGARYQSVETNANATPGLDVTGLDFDDDAFVGSIGVLYALTRNLNVTSSYSSSFRAPNIVERLFNGPTPEGLGFQIVNPDLVSEEGLTFDIGLKYLSRRAHFEVSYFDTTIEDGIVQHFLTDSEIAGLPEDVQDEIAMLSPEFVVQQRNVEKLDVEGFELAGGFRFENGVTLGGNYTHLDSRRVDSTNPPTGDTVTDKLNAWVRYQPGTGRYWLEYRLRHNGDEKANIDPGEPVPPVGEVIPSFTVHRLGGGLSIPAGNVEHRLGLAIDNLTDELYAEFSNATFFRPQAGRNVIVSYGLGF